MVNQQKQLFRQSGWKQLGYGLIGLWAVLGAIATAIDLGTVDWLERESQRLFFRLTFLLKTTPPPDNIVILAMDEESLARGADYLNDPKRYPELEPIQRFPWQRTAYAVVIDKLMAAGARSVSIDVLLDAPSAYGVEDDQHLYQALQRHPGRVVLATSYEPAGSPEMGEQLLLVAPNPVFRLPLAQQGLIKFLVDPDGRVHQLPESFIDKVLHPQGINEQRSSFAVATLQAAHLPRPNLPGGDIYFYGPPTTFPRVPFWHVLDPTNWAVHLKDQTFKDKIVLIGPIATDFKDNVRTPLSEEMPGIEVHANAIATLLQQRNIQELIPNPLWAGVVVLLGIGGTGFLLSQYIQKPVRQFWGALVVFVLWGGISYVIFIKGKEIIPTAVPLIGITFSGVTLLTTGAIGYQLEQRRLRQTLERYVAAPVVEEILTHYSDDFQSLLKGRRIKAAVLFCDIRGFTTLSLTLEPEQLVEQLNVYLNGMVEVILETGGTVDKFIGDAIMAEFGSPISQGAETDAINAIRAALGMRQALLQLQEYWKSKGQQVLFNGIGINYGEAIAGDIGSARRREYALIGDAVNIASRVEGMTRKFCTDILITDTLYELVSDRVEVEDVGAHSLKGRETNKVTLYKLIGLKGEDQASYHEIHQKLEAIEQSKNQ